MYEIHILCLYIISNQVVYKIHIVKLCLVYIICLHESPDPDYNQDNVNQTHLIQPYYPNHQPMGNIQYHWTPRHWTDTWCGNASVESD